MAALMARGVDRVQPRALAGWIIEDRLPLTAYRYPFVPMLSQSVPPGLADPL